MINLIWIPAQHMAPQVLLGITTEQSYVILVVLEHIPTDKVYLSLYKLVPVIIRKRPEKRKKKGV